MNPLTRSSLVLICLTACGIGAMSVGHRPIDTRSFADNSVGFDLQGGYEFASIDGISKFGQIEAIVRADAAQRFPNARVEFGSVKAEQGMVTITVVLFGAGKQVYLYGLVPDKASWKIASARRLWFVPPSQIVRGLRV